MGWQQKKKIMVVSNNRKNAEQLKFELEQRKVCDIVDIYTAANPKKLLEDLIINKGKESYDYRMFIIDEGIDSPDFLLSQHLKRNYPTAHLVLWCYYYQRPKTPKDIRSNLFASEYKPGMTFQQCLKAFIKKHYYGSDERWVKGFESDKSNYQQEINECEKAINVERYNYHRNYIIKDLRRGKMHYGRMASKLKHILVTGLYDGRAPKFYPSLEAERKAKSKKAYYNIISSQAPKGWGITSFFKSALSQYDEDVTDIIYAIDIVKRLRSYEKDAKQELESIQKYIREFEDRFPSVVEDPSVFEVAKPHQQEQQQQRKEEDRNKK